MQDTIQLTINGLLCQGISGQTILEVAREAKIEIPTLCHDPRLAPYASCGLCVVEMAGTNRLMRACATAISEGMQIVTDSPRVKASRRNTLELLLSDHNGDCRPPCMLACPAQTDCQGYVGLIANGQYREAVALIKEKLPLPTSIGLVCPHPCENACRRALVEAPIAIADLKAFVGEIDLLDDPYMPSVASSSGKRVAVVGAGPAGLTAAYFLARDGHQVSIYDAMPQPGGMLRYGIPEYRLPKAILDQEISLIQGLGVELVMNTRLGTDLSLDKLRQDYDAVFLGLGAWVSSKVRCPGEELAGVIGGIDFLREVTLTGTAPIGQQVAIIGGGNTAMDAARTAIRLGAKQVMVLYRRTRQEMPADDREIEEAMEEGVIFKYLCAPIEITGDAKVNGIRLQMMQLGEADASGRRRPEPILGAEELVPLDTIIAAIGQEVVCPDLPGLEQNKWGNIAVDKNTLMTSLAGVFAGGDAVTGPGIAIEAIAQGQQAAQAISAYFQGTNLVTSQPYLVKRSEVTAATLKSVPKQQRTGHTLLEASDRSTNFRRVTLTMQAEAAVKEASRCLECGCHDYFECRLIQQAREYNVAPERLQGAQREEITREHHVLLRRDSEKCILCGLCVRICAEVMGVEALGLVGRGFDTMVKPMFGMPLDQAGCISCGQCAAVCPTGALVDNQNLSKQVPLNLVSTVTTCSGCSLGCQQELQSYGHTLVRALPTEKGLLCEQGRVGWYNYQSERPLSPLIRQDGELQAVSWEAALDYINRQIVDIKKLDQAETVALYAAPSLTQEEVSALVNLGRDQIGTEQILTLTPCVGQAINKVLDNTDCLTSIEELITSDQIIMLGSFSHSAVVAARVRSAVKQGVPLLVVDPRTTLVDDIAEIKIGYTNNIQLLKEASKYLLSTYELTTSEQVTEQVKTMDSTPEGNMLAEALAGATRPLFLIDGYEVTEETVGWVGQIIGMLNSMENCHSGLVIVAAGANSRGLAYQGVKPWHKKLAFNQSRLAIVMGEDPLGQGIWSMDEVKSLEMLVVVAAKMNLTAQMADVVLPLSLPWETSGHYIDAAGIERELQQVLNPPSGLTNLEIIARLQGI